MHSMQKEHPSSTTTTHGQENNSNLPGKDLKEDEERKMFNEYGIDKTTVQTLF